MNVVTPQSSLAVPDSREYYGDSAFPLGCSLPYFGDSLGGFAGEIGLSAEMAGEGGGSCQSRLYDMDFLTDSPVDCLNCDWLTQSMSLPTPDEQAGDQLMATFPLPEAHDPQVLAQSKFSPLSYPSVDLQLQASPESLVSTPSSSILLTPASSYPGSPQSEYCADEAGLQDIMSSLLDNDQFSSSETTVSPVSTTMAAAISPYSPGTSSFDLATPLSSPVQSYEGSLSPAGSVCSLVKPEEQVLPLPCSRGYEEELYSSTALSQSKKQKVVAQIAASSSKSPRKKTSGNKKERKKEQNKTAALRYRQRKREEKMQSESLIQQLERKNHDLKMKAESISNEIRYLQKLWSEVSEAKKQSCSLPGYMH